MEYRRLRDIAISTQYGYTSEETSLVEGKYKYLRITDIVPYFVDFDRVPYCTIPDSKVNQYLVEEGDILVARTGATTGYNYVVGKDVKNTVFASYLIRFKIDEKQVEPTYLKYIMKSQMYYGFVKNYIGGSAQPGMNAKVFGRFNFPLPALPIQRRIASILSSYDNLIELNTRRIKLLEQMAENLYKEWFVRFRFPNYQNTPIENGIPKGWKVEKLNTFGKIETGKTPSMEISENYGGDILFVKTPDMHKQLFVFNTEEKLTEKGHSSQPKKLIPQNSIMVSCIGTAGVVAINAKPAHTNQQINSIIPTNKSDLEWLYFACRGLKETIQLFGATGATMTNLSKGKFEKLKLITPPIDLRVAYHNTIQPLFSEIATLQTLSANLTRQRDLLLPRLMSGQLPTQ